jgi:hypothetical protein
VRKEAARLHHSLQCPLTVVNATKAFIKIVVLGALAGAAIGTIVSRSVYVIDACGLD